MTKKMLFGTALVILVLLGATMNLLTGYWTRNQLVQSSRTQCVTQGENLVGDVRALRAQAHADRLIATDPSQSARTRRARGLEVGAFLASIDLKDARIDWTLWRSLHSRLDQNYVRYGVPLKGIDGEEHREAPYSCTVVYPSSPLIP